MRQIIHEDHLIDEHLTIVMRTEGNALYVSLETDGGNVGVSEVTAWQLLKAAAIVSETLAELTE